MSTCDEITKTIAELEADIVQKIDAAPTWQAGDPPQSK